MARYNPDVVKNHAAQVAPIAFLGKHSPKTPGKDPYSIQRIPTEFMLVFIETESSVAAWDELWLETVPGTEAGLRIYLTDIVAYLQRAITSSSWKLKSQSAAAIGSMARSLKGALEPAQRDGLLRILLDGLSGRTWQGKEHLLQALASLCSTQTIEETQQKGCLICFRFCWIALF